MQGAPFALHHADVAQLVAHRTRNSEVTGSNPVICSWEANQARIASPAVREPPKLLSEWCRLWCSPQRPARLTSRAGREVYPLI